MNSDATSKPALQISGEYLLPRCGLANYLELLVKFMTKERPGTDIQVRSFGPLWDESDLNRLSMGGLEIKSIVRPSVRDFILRHIRPKLPDPVWSGVLRLISTYNYLTVHRSVARHWRREPGDTCVLLPHIPLDPVVRGYYRALMDLRLVWVIHDLHPFYFPEAWDAPALKMCRTILPELARRARRIIVHNQFTHDSAVKHLGADPAKMTIIRLPHLMDQTAPDPAASDDAILASMGVRKPYALWASSTTIKHKNHERLIRAWVKVQSRRSGRIQLVCSGNRHPRWQEVEPVLKAAEGKADIVFTNTVPKESLRVLLRNAALAVCPTLFEGGGCGPAMEANYAGVPVVCSNIPQIREIYEERDDLCLYFDPLDEDSIAAAVLSALADPEGSRRRADRVLEWLENQRTWKDVARDYWNVIDAALHAAQP